MNFSDKWKNSLEGVLNYYDSNKPPFWSFFPRLFLFFVVINLFCYWWATATAFPGSILNSFFYYFKVQFPVGILGAVFDSLSFFVTVFIIRRALKAMSTLRFVSHLSIDILIAILATFWVLFVFSFSSWLIRLTEVDPGLSAELVDRQNVYRQRMENAVEYPLQNKRNIYFGIVMGISAILPTLFHFYMAIRSNLKKIPKWLLHMEDKVINHVSKSFDKMNDNGESL
jgi:hypothetical protein